MYVCTMVHVLACTAYTACSDITILITYTFIQLFDLQGLNSKNKTWLPPDAVHWIHIQMSQCASPMNRLHTPMNNAKKDTKVHCVWSAPMDGCPVVHPNWVVSNATVVHNCIWPFCQCLGCVFWSVLFCFLCWFVQ